MSERLPLLRPEELSADQRALYDKLVTGKRAGGSRAFPLADEEGRLQGPFNGMLLSPGVGDALQQVGAALRFAGALTARQRELATLTVAASESAAYEWAAHTHLACTAGLTDSQIGAIRDDAPLDLPDAAEHTVLTATRELVRTGNLSDASFAQARDVLGMTALYELITLVGYYRLLALQMRVLDVRVPE